MASELGESPTRQYAMAVVVPVKVDLVDQLRKQLSTINEETISRMRGYETPTTIPFHEMESVHYARFVLIEASHEHGDPALLILSTNYDGAIGSSRRNKKRARTAHIDDLVGKAYKGLDEIYACCEGYERKSSRRTLVAYLLHKQHQISAKTFYVGSSGRSRQQIIYETELREQIEDAADQVKKLLTDSAGSEEIRDAILAELKKMGVTIPPPFPPQPDGKKNYERFKPGRWPLGIVSLPITLPLIGIAKYIAIPIAKATLRRHEEKDVPDYPRHDAETVAHTRRVSIEENLFMQNQLTHLVDIKEGWFRLRMIKFVFMILQCLSTNIFNKGRLGNIPSIHFARWLFIGRKRRVLFLSNFDNSWQSYLGDFVDQASSGLTAVWSNTKGYPKTKDLLRFGSRNATSFLAWTRAHQLPTDVWYSAYPALTLRKLNANTLLRRGLTDRVGVPAKDWLHTLAGEDITPLKIDEMPDELPEPVKLPVEDIQGIILKGYGFLEHAAFIMLRVNEAVPARKWLSKLPITSASTAAEQAKFAKETEAAMESGAVIEPHPSADITFVNIAFSHTGLQALKLDDTFLGMFPPEFIEGSHSKYRSRVLGDTGENDPDNWKWGNDELPTHVLLMLYCHTSEKLKKELSEYLSNAELHGLSIVGVPLEGNKLRGRKEHFGFRDGIAQPFIRHNPLNSKDQEEKILAPGEFLLGYPDGYHTDRDKSDANIAFAPTLANGYEFCKGGSYLVFRQLEQKVKEFWKYFDQAAKSADTNRSTIALASKAVGRWPNGEPLVLEAQSPGHPQEASDEDTFSYMSPSEKSDTDDRHGNRCPLGSHIRRTNPRDWLLGNNTVESARLSKLHRIIRRARPYGEPLEKPVNSKDEQSIDLLVQEALSGNEDNKPRGLCFICFNANIERQFEFVQQQWVNNAQVGVLPADADPVIGMQHRNSEEVGGGEPAFTIQEEPLRQRCPGLSDFVSVVGSGYFFMPTISSVCYLEKI